MPPFVQVHTAKRWYYDFIGSDYHLATRTNLQIYEKNLIETTKRFRKSGHVIFIDDVDSKIEDTIGKYHDEITPTTRDVLLCDKDGEAECANRIIKILYDSNEKQAYIGGVYEDACILSYTGYLATHGINVHIIESCTDAILREDSCKMLSCVVFSTNENVNVIPYSRERLKVIRRAIELRDKLRDWKNLAEAEKAHLIEAASKFKTRSNYIFKPFAHYAHTDLKESLVFGDEKDVITLAGERGITVFEARKLSRELYHDFMKMARQRNF